MKYIKIVLIFLLLGCSEEYKLYTNGRKVINDNIEYCINGVVYYKHIIDRGGSYSPKFLSNSKVETCE